MSFWDHHFHEDQLSLLLDSPLSETTQDAEVVPSPEEVLRAEAFIQPHQDTSKYSSSSSPVLWTPDSYSFDFEWDDWQTRRIAAPSGRYLEILERLGITARQFEWFQRFVGHPWVYAIRYPGANWYYPTREDGNPWVKPLSNHHLISHLTHEFWIATGARKSTAPNKRGHHTVWYFAVDLDYRPKDHADGETAMADLRRRYDAIAACLGTPSLVFQSSASGGLHLYYLLTAPVDLNRLSTGGLPPKKQTGRGAIERLLRASDIEIAPARCEFYPCPTLKGESRGNRLRLPFGRDSRLLCADALTPLTKGCLGEDLRLVADRLEQERVRLYAFQSFFDRAQALPKEAPQQPRKGRQQPARGTKTGGRGSDTGVSTSDLWKDGLPGPNTLDAAIPQLFWSCWYEGRSEPWTTDRIVRLLRAKHNGHSKDFNESLDKGEAVVRRKLRPLFRKWGPGIRTIRELPGLSRSELTLIIDSAPLSACCDQYGELKLKNYVLQRFLFESLQHHKARVLDRMRQARDEIRQDRPDLPPESDEFLREWMKRLADLRPDWDQQTFVVPWPDEKRRKLTGMKSDGRFRYWAAARDASGLYELALSADFTKRRCEYYRVPLQLVELSDTAGFTEFAFALQSTLTTDEIRQKYSRNYADKIRRAVPRLGARVDGELIELVQRAQKRSLRRAA